MTVNNMKYSAMVRPMRRPIGAEMRRNLMRLAIINGEPFQTRINTFFTNHTGQTP